MPLVKFGSWDGPEAAYEHPASAADIFGLILMSLGHEKTTKISPFGRNEAR